MASYLKIIFIVLIIITKGNTSSMNIEYENAFDQELYKRVLDANKCDQQLNYFNINNTLLGMTFTDASGKFPSGLLTGNLADVGNYHGCLNIRHVDGDMEIEGKYCMVTIPLKQFNDLSYPYLSNNSIFKNVQDFRSTEDIEFIRTFQRRAHFIFGDGSLASRDISTNIVGGLYLSLGTCIPKVCTAKQAISFILQGTVPNKELEFNEYYYRLPNDKPFSIADYLAMVFFSLIASITLISTSYDLYHIFVLKNVQQTPTPSNFSTTSDNSQINRLYRCFSIYTNTKRLFTFNTSPDALECMDGIRAISMLWVIFGHAYSTTMLTFVYNLFEIRTWLTSFTSTWINSAPITVDTFFLLSGILCVYSVIGKISRRQFIRSIHLFYLYRLLRIVPLLATVILLQASFVHQMSDGPKWINIGQATAMCRKRWWSALLHVQNYVKPIGMCLDHSWYLSVDIQLYIASPIVLIWLFGNNRVAWCALTLAILISIALSSTYSFMYNFSAALTHQSQAVNFKDYFVDYYINTLTRASPFFIGMMYGYLLHKYRGKNINVKKIAVSVIWVSTFMLMAFCIFSTYPVVQEDHDKQWFDNFLNAYMRGIWAIAVGLMIFLCVHGYGGPINWFLSLQMWKLPARLSYAMYLVHYPILLVANGSIMSTHYFSDGDTLYRAMGALAFTSIGAFILSVTIDAPFSIIQKLLLGGGGKNKPSKSSESGLGEEKI